MRSLRVSTRDLRSRRVGVVALPGARIPFSGSTATGAARERPDPILEAEVVAALAVRNAGIAADAAARFVRPGDRFRYVGDVWRVVRVGRGPRGVVAMAREIPDPSDRFEKVALVDDREFPRYILRDTSYARWSRFRASRVSWRFH